MEEIRNKLLNDENENVVQFNLVNTTSSPIFVNLFNTSEGLSSIPNSVTYINQNTIINSFGTLGSPYTGLSINTIDEVIPSPIQSFTGDIYTCNGSNKIFVFSQRGVLISSFVYAFANFTFADYNPINNQLYAVDSVSGDIYVTDCTNFTLTATITTSIVSPTSSTYDKTTNTIYYVNTSTNLFSINCNTNTQNANIISAENLFSVTYNSINNQLYLTTTVNTCIIYSLVTNLFLLITFLFPTLGQSSEFNFTDNTLYITSNSTDDVYFIDCSLNIGFSTINLAGLVPRNITFDSNQNRMYLSSSATENIAVINCLSNSLLTTITANQSNAIVFNANNDSVYFGDDISNNIQQITTKGIANTPYYISGSVNYNLFLNNLNNEPVSIQMIRLLVVSQNQLFNQLQLTKIDSNGNQIFLPDFPINQVSAYQQQGNIGEIPLDNIVFDGRTYINQYQLNAKENVSFEIYYKQLDLTSASPTFPIFFKPKIQLKDYIKNN